MSRVPLPSSSLDADKPRESLSEKLLRKCKQQPLVPLGATLTCGALFLASRALRTGNARLANRMFYWRVGFQGLTIAALIGGAYYFNDNDVGGFRGTPQEMFRKKSKERERLWIAELERIEEEAQVKRKEAEELKQKLASAEEKPEAKAESETKQSEDRREN